MFPGSHERALLKSWKECKSTLAREYIGIDIGIHIPASDTTFSVGRTLSPVHKATVEATEEAILARAMTKVDCHVRCALPLD
jgi:hypothetical protein